MSKNKTFPRRVKKPVAVSGGIPVYAEVNKNQIKSSETAEYENSEYKIVKSSFHNAPPRTLLTSKIEFAQTPTPQASASPIPTQTPDGKKNGDGKKNIFEKFIDWIVRLFKKKPPPVQNQSPTINSLTISDTEVRLPCPPRQTSDSGCNDSTSLSVATNATAPENDPLVYQYTVSGGTIQGTGANVTWDVSGLRPGTYTLSVAVDNGGIYGQPRQETIRVVECPDCREPIRRPPPCPLTSVNVSASQTVVQLTETVTFTAAADAGGQNVTYNWSVNGAEVVSGQGTPSFRVRATAPGTITVAVETATNDPGCRASGSANVDIAGMPINTNANSNNGNLGNRDNSNNSANADTNIQTPTPANTNVNSNLNQNTNSNAANQSNNINTNPVSPYDEVKYSYPSHLLNNQGNSSNKYFVDLTLQPSKTANPTPTTEQTNVNNTSTVVSTESVITEKKGYETFVNAELITDFTLNSTKAQCPQNESQNNLPTIEQFGKIWKKYERKGEAQIIPCWKWDISLNNEAEEKRLDKVQYTLRLEILYKSIATGNYEPPAILWDKPLSSGVGLPPFIGFARWLFIFSGLSILLLGFVSMQGNEMPAQISDGVMTNASVVNRDEKDADEVHCTLYAPKEVKAGDTLAIQVFAHLLEQIAGIEAIAKGLDEETAKRITETLERKISRGAELTFKLKIPGLTFTDDEQICKWEGKPVKVLFKVLIPENHINAKRIGTVIVYDGKEKIGTIDFGIKIIAKKDLLSLLIDAIFSLLTILLTSPKTQRARMTKYDSAFISYASRDKKRVYSHLPLLDGMEVAYHVDILSIKPGDRWKQKLYEFIDEDDIFILFWSKAAKRSEYVIMEAEYAHKRAGEDRKNPPRIIIYHLDDPPTDLPEWLADIHTDRQWRELIKKAGRQKEDAKKRRNSTATDIS